MSYTFPKEEKLKNKKAIEKLFAEGKSFSHFPIRIVYRENELMMNRVAISVSKKHFKHAVDRNLYKRSMREAYRLNKSILLEKSTTYDLMFLFLSKEKTSYDTIEQALQKVLRRLISISDSLEVDQLSRK